MLKDKTLKSSYPASLPSLLRELGETIPSTEGLNQAGNFLLQTLLKAVGETAGSLLLFDPQKRELKISASIGIRRKKLSIPISKESESQLTQGGLVFLKDGSNIPGIPKKYQAELSALKLKVWVPLTFRDEFFGVIILSNENESHLLSLIAQYASIAMYNSKLLRMMKQIDFNSKLRILELETLMDISQEISSVLEIESLLEEVAARTLGLLDVSGCCLMLIDEDDPARLRIASILPDSDLIGRRVSIGKKGVLRAIVVRGQMKLLNRCSKNSFPTLPVSCRKFLGVPIKSRSGILGVLCAFDKERRDGSIADFSESDQNMLQSFASQVAVALENARLYQSIKKANQEIQDTYLATMDALVAALDMRDTETSNHSRRVVEYSIMIAKAIGIEEQELQYLRWGAILHDIGKIGIPDAILRKAGPLTKKERKKLEDHPEIGYNMLGKIEFLKDVMPVVRYHQERYDGRGYPSRLAGEEIPMGARIFAVADTFDAMTSDRPYRKALSYEEARDEIRACSGTQFDPKVVEAFLKIPKEVWEIVRKALRL